MTDNKIECSCDNCKYNNPPHYVEPYEEPCNHCNMDMFEPYVDDGKLHRLTVSQCPSSEWCLGYNAAVNRASEIINRQKADIESLKKQLNRLYETSIPAIMPMADWLRDELTAYVHKRCLEEL